MFCLGRRSKLFWCNCAFVFACHREYSERENGGLRFIKIFITRKTTFQLLVGPFCSSPCSFEKFTEQFG